MKIKVFTTISESYSHGDLDSSDKKYFMTKKLRDDYFNNVLRNDYLSNEYLEEYELNHFCAKTGSKRWSYFIEKNQEELEIIEEKTW